MKYEFTQDLYTGNEKIDGQHKKLIEAVNALFEACAAGKGRQEIGKAASFLSEYTQTHFRDEELLQIQYKYPNYAPHKRAHDQFILVVKGALKKLDEQGPSVALVGEMNAMIAGWLINHIKKEDVRVAAHIRGASGGI